MHRRKKRAFSLWHAATALAAVGGTGLFAAAVALQGRPVRVPVIAYQARRTSEDGSGRIKHDAVKRRGSGDDDTLYSADDKFDADVVGRMVDEAIVATGGRFSPGGKKFADHFGLKINCKNPKTSLEPLDLLATLASHVCV